MNVPLQQPVTTDVVGAFRFVCSAGALLYDDPIVYPGQPGKSHLHQFFGNTGANANSTYDSLRTSGLSTCMSPINRSAYWMPAMLNGRGQVIRPDYITIYYKRSPKDAPECKTATGNGGCIALPNGLRYIFGYNMVGHDDPRPGSHYFTCSGANKSNNIIDTAKYCAIGKHLGAATVAPGCWDGKNLDSPDHRSHMSTYDSRGLCPDTHPWRIPHFSMVSWYTIDDTLDLSGVWPLAPGQTTWSLASDNMAGLPPARPGTTLHADWFGAWDNQMMATWVDNCIDRKLSCNSGDLGNGKAMKMFKGFSWNANPRLVDLPQS
ncbi:MAG: DUF1996 domain-containing protein [Sphingomonas sp.]|nr:DUF1996 domain-containing protein [Sphingomonas sp.]